MSVVHDNLPLLRDWREFPGSQFGLRQKTAVATVRLPLLQDVELQAFEKRMEKITGLGGAIQDVPEGTGLRILDFMFAWYFSLHSDYKVPAFPEFVLIGRLENHDRKFMDCTFAVAHVSDVSRNAMSWIIDMLRSTDHDNLEKEKELFEDLGKLMRLRSVRGTNGIHFARAAFDIGVEFRILPRNIVSVGTGRRNRWLDSSVSDETSHIGVQLCGNKYATNRLLHSFGLPVPRQRIVNNLEQCRKLGAEFGFPLVIKPARKEQGEGVTSGIRTADRLEEAYQDAAKIDDMVLMERHHDGLDLRFTVVRGKVCKILSRRAGAVVGDGKSTVKDLVYREQCTDRMQRLFRQYGRYLLDLDAEAQSLLREHGMTSDSIPGPGVHVPLRRKNNISAGGAQSLVPVSEVHGDNIELAVQASNVLRMDIAGVDMIVPDVARSWRDTGGVIIEVNARPQIGVSLAPETYRIALLRVLRHRPHIPCHLLIIDDNEKITLESLMQHAKKTGVHCLATKRGIWFHGRKQSGFFHTGFEACIATLQDKRVHSVLFVLSANEIIAYGFPCSRYRSISDYGVLGIKRLPTVQEQQALKLSTPYLK